MSEGEKGFFGRLVEGLTKTRKSIAQGFDYIFSGFSHIDDDFYPENCGSFDSAEYSAYRDGGGCVVIAPLKLRFSVIVTEDFGFYGFGFAEYFIT